MFWCLKFVFENLCLYSDLKQHLCAAVGVGVGVGGVHLVDVAVDEGCKCLMIIFTVLVVFTKIAFY